MDNDRVPITFEQEMQRELALAYIRARTTPEGRLADFIARRAASAWTDIRLQQWRCEGEWLATWRRQDLERATRRHVMRKQGLLPPTVRVVTSGGLYVGIDSTWPGT